MIIRCCIGTCKARLEGQKVTPVIVETVDGLKQTALAKVVCPRGHENTVQGETRRALEEAAKGDLFARASTGAVEALPERMSWGPVS